MTITSSVQDQFVDKSTNKLIYLPVGSTYASRVPPIDPVVSGSAGFSVLTSRVASSAATNSVEVHGSGTSWTNEEHARFLAGLELFPTGPWKAIAHCVGTRTARQTMSHAQKYRQKIARRQRGLRHVRRKGIEQQHRDLDVLPLIKTEAETHAQKPSAESPEQQNQAQDPQPEAVVADISAILETDCEISAGMSFSDTLLDREVVDEVLTALFSDENESFEITQDELDTIFAPKNDDAQSL
ncbi:Myb-like dna-binding, partial [Globisporangium splendens]